MRTFLMTKVSNSTSPILPSPASAIATTPSSPLLSSADFPALQGVAAASTVPSIIDSSNNSNNNTPNSVTPDQAQPSPPPAGSGDAVANPAGATSDPTVTPAMSEKDLAKAERKAAKKEAAAERAAERQRLAAEKAVVRAAEKERIAVEKAAEKERLAKEKAEKDRVAREKVEKERIAKEAAEKERLEKLEREKMEREKVAREKAEEARKAQEAKEKAATAALAAQKAKQAATVSTPATPNAKATVKTKATKPVPAPPAPPAPEPTTQAPILAKMPKKNKPVTKPIKIPKEDTHDVQSTAGSATAETPQIPEARTVESSSNNSRAHSVDPSSPVTLEEMFCDLDMQFPWMNIPRHPFFDLTKINPSAKMPLEYGPLVHALSALSVGGGSFANNMPSGSIDNAVSSFQQLLETLTQTISDLLRLLPRTTWDDSSSFDGVLRDMLKGDDFLEDGGDDQNGHGKEDEVAALTMALERRARWMEVQLSKLEELHRDINTAAVRAVLSFNDNGWDHSGFMPKIGNTLQRFDELGYVKVDGELQAMSGDELAMALTKAKEVALFAEAELVEAMSQMREENRPLAEDEW